MTSLKQDNGYIVLLNRGYKSVPDYTAPGKARFGVNQSTPTGAETDLDYPIPILDGTVNDDGSNTLTGSSGGDNSTDNTTTYKPGAGVTDATAQNLIANGTSVTKIWTISNLASAGTNMDGTKYAGLWLYIKDSATLIKFAAIGAAVRIKLGSDSSNYYTFYFNYNSLSVGWNWLSDTGVLNTWYEVGTVSGNIDTFIIEITTRSATYTFAEGDVVYDLLRQWERSDTILSFDSGYPSINESTIQAEIKATLNSVQANGFPVDSFAIENTDSTPLMTDINTMTDESKSDTDEFIFTDITGK